MSSYLTMSKSSDEEPVNEVGHEPSTDHEPQVDDPSNAQKTRTWMRCLFDFLHGVVTEVIGCLVKS